MENSSLSTASEYRPQEFKDVIGQDAIVKTLSNAIENQNIPQALLFCGPRGVGKTSCARILAKKINNLTENYETLTNLGYSILGVSCDKPKSQKNFSTKFGFPYPLLADVDKKVV